MTLLESVLSATTKWRARNRTIPSFNVRTLKKFDRLQQLVGLFPIPLTTGRSPDIPFPRLPQPLLQRGPGSTRQVAVL